LLKQLPSLDPWHHTIDLGDGITTTKMQHSGYNPEERWKAIEPFIPKDLTGKTVLDLGCNSGYLSMKMKKRGASRVVAVDVKKRNIKQAEFISKWFDVELELVNEEAHVYCLTNEERFDYVIFLGLFYHLKYGTLVLDRLAEMTKSKLFFQTVTLGSRLNNYEPIENYAENEKKKIVKSEDYPKLFFIENKFNNDLSNWWISNDAAVISLLRSAGLKIIARPSPQIHVCEPEKFFGKKIYPKMVFPKYGKKGGFIFP